MATCKVKPSNVFFKTPSTRLPVTLYTFIREIKKKKKTAAIFSRRIAIIKTQHSRRFQSAENHVLFQSNQSRCVTTQKNPN